MSCPTEVTVLLVMLVATGALLWRACVMIARGRRWTKSIAVIGDARGASVLSGELPRGRPLATFSLPDGQSAEAPLTYLSDDPPLVGDRVTIVYDPSNPTRAEPFVGAVFGLIYLLVCAAVAAAAIFAIAQRLASAC